MKLEDKQTRTIVLMDPDGGSDMIAAMSALKKGDRFRIETDMIGDHLHGHGKEVWVALSDAYEIGRHGEWGIDCVESYKCYDAGDVAVAVEPDAEPAPRLGEACPAEADDGTVLRVGNVVRLRSGGPMMTVVNDTDETDRRLVCCAWIRDNGKPSRAVFPSACLFVDRKVK